MSIRLERINKMLHEELVQLVQYELADPRVEGAEVTRVAVSRDLTSARVFYALRDHTPGDPEVAACQAGLEHAAGFLKRQLARAVNLRRTPDLLFTFDNSARVLDIIEHLEIPPEPEPEPETAESAGAAEPGEAPGAVDELPPAPASEAGIALDLHGLRVEILAADLTAQAVDAIVNAANTELLMTAGVAGAIVRAGGPSIQEECRALAPLGLGEAIVTGGGKLPAGAVIHAAVMSLKGGAPPAATLAAAYAAALARAEERGFAAVALPAFGTGAGGYSLEESARLLRGVLDAWTAHDHGAPRRLVVCLIDEAARDAFAAGFGER